MHPDPVEPPPPAAGAWFVYVLWSGTLERTYVGLAVDIARRVRQHGGELAGGARTTRAGRPWCLVAWYGPFPDRSGATRAERAVKALKGAARLRWVEAGHRTVITPSSTEPRPSPRTRNRPEPDAT